MSRAARTLAIVVALIGIVVGSAALVRAAALAADDAVAWPWPAWWDDLAGGPASWATALVAAAVAVAAIACLLLAFRQLAPPQPPQTVEAGGARVKVVALERVLATRLAAELPGLGVRAVRLSWTETGWDVWALVDAPARDLSGVRARAALVAGAELSRAAGGALARLDLDVRRFVAGP
jgi:hypothetical protein